MHRLAVSEHKAAGKYKAVAATHKKILEQVNLNMLQIIKRYTDKNGKRKFVNFGELFAVVSALTVGKKLVEDLAATLVIPRH